MAKKINLKDVIVFLCIFVVFSPFLLYLNMPKYTSYLYFTVVPYKESLIENLDEENMSFYLTSSSSFFADMLLGWFHNPGFIKEIKENYKTYYTNEDLVFPNLKYKLIGRTNIMIYFDTSSDKNTKQALNSIENVIKSRIENYNSKSESRFSIVNIDQVTENKNNSIIFNILIYLSLCIVICFSYIFIKILYKFA